MVRKDLPMRIPVSDPLHQEVEAFLNVSQHPSLPQKKYIKTVVSVNNVA